LEVWKLIPEDSAPVAFKDDTETPRFRGGHRQEPLRSERLKRDALLMFGVASSLAGAHLAKHPVEELRSGFYFNGNDGLACSPRHLRAQVRARLLQIGGCRARPGGVAGLNHQPLQVTRK